MKREEAIFVLKELLDTCNGLDGHYLELSNPCASLESVGGIKLLFMQLLTKKQKNKCKKFWLNMALVVKKEPCGRQNVPKLRLTHS
ncbi:MAG: hypothetical protein ACOWW1_07435 [archaeon]